ncbi:alpha-glucuronidase family glycosyl hydrolase [Chryseolinea sp. T2]|uniref:alpha-glucuronidase family glycosyl hydrolase n=1 Tax=Chryseolinea sp. T2 TaxID=3129255 RepID=UPI003076BEEB
MVSNSDEAILQKPIAVLTEEIFRRTGITLNIRTNVSVATSPDRQIVIASTKSLTSLPAQLQSSLNDMKSIGKDGYKLFMSADSRTLVITGDDARSVLYGVGCLLRKATMKPEKILIPRSVTVSTTPANSIRGHQLGYRPKTNSYDAFSVGQFDQYIRELALFGANSIEIVPPRTDDDPTSAHMKLAPIKMIAEQSRICKSYGLDVWMWYPNMGTNYADEKTVREELMERDSVFAAVEKLDAVFVPGGDPGELEPDALFAWLEKQSVVLNKYHPDAKIWVSPQVFRPTKQWLTSFYRYVNKKYSWFGGVVYGPWIKTPVDSMRRLIDPTIPIRMYPDITHSLSAQYPIPDWDLAWAMTLGRECINPRPKDEKHIHNIFASLGVGSISYSEGTNDDVNKFVWSDQDWDPNIPVEETLRDYARLFISADHADAIAKGIFELEENMRGPLLSSKQVSKTLEHFQSLEKVATPEMINSFRFQMCLLRAYYDAYTQQRLVRETGLEKEAYTALSRAAKTGSLEAIAQAGAILNKSTEAAPYDSYKVRCMKLADDLFKSIGAQLTIKKHGAAGGRGNFIDNIDVPLNDAPWLNDQMKKIAIVQTEDERLKAIDALLHRQEPGEGGIYTNFGTPSAKPYVLPGLGWSKDPGGLLSPMVNFGVGTKEDEWVHEILPVGFSGQTAPKAWMTQTGTLYETPLNIQYKGLDPKSAYRIRIAYTGRLRSRIKLTANGYLVHDYFLTGDQPIYTFDIPTAALSGGNVTFTFVCPEGEQGAQVSEIWIEKVKSGTAPKK